MYNKYLDVDTIKSTNTEIFSKKYSNKQPVLVKECFKESRTTQSWCNDFRKIAENVKVNVTKGRSVNKELLYLGNNLIEDYNKKLVEDLYFTPKLSLGTGICQKIGIESC